MTTLAVISQPRGRARQLTAATAQGWLDKLAPAHRCAPRQMITTSHSSSILAPRTTSQSSMNITRRDAKDGELPLVKRNAGRRIGSLRLVVHQPQSPRLQTSRAVSVSSSTVEHRRHPTTATMTVTMIAVVASQTQPPLPQYGTSRGPIHSRMIELDSAPPCPGRETDRTPISPLAKPRDLPLQIRVGRRHSNS